MRSVKQVFDFHCHSTASDGLMTPNEMLELAITSGLEVWSLTDHDTLEGYKIVKEVLSASEDVAEDSRLRVIPGVELSCDWNGVTVHILAYGFESSSQSMLTFLAKQQERRRQRAIKIGERIQEKLKFENAYERACLISANCLPARPHFARLLVEHNIVGSFGEAFNKYLGAGKWGDIKLYWPQLDELMQAVKQSAAICVIAHPFHYKMTATKLRCLFDEFGGLGGDGVELSVPNINTGHYGWLVNELSRRKFIQSGGSDFHGTPASWSRLGFFPSLCDRIPSVLDVLNET